MHNGPHLLAPTGSDMKQHGAVGTIFAGRRRCNKRATAGCYPATANCLGCNGRFLLAYRLWHS
jgi:hypothetical protein